MRQSSHLHDKPAEFEVIASFGGAELVKRLNGKVELRGGSVEDQREAREWIAKFLPRVAAALPGPLERRNK